MQIKRSGLVLLIILCAMSIILSQIIFASPDVILFEIEEDYPPYKFTIGDEFRGYEIEVSEQIFKDSNYKIKYSQDTWKNVYERLKEGKIDTCGMLVVNEERKKEILFSDTILISFIAVYSKKEKQEIKLDEIGNYTIGVGGSQYTESILKNQLGVKNYITYDNIKDAIHALNDGEIDILFENQQVTNHFLIEMGLKGALIPQHTKLFPTEVAYGVSRGNEELLEFINKRFHELEKSGVHEQLYYKYFDEPSMFKLKSDRMRVCMFIICVIMFIIFLQLYIRYLKKKIAKNYKEYKKHYDWSRVTLSSIGDAVITTDENGYITYTNFCANQLLSKTSEELEGNLLNNIFRRFKDKQGESVDDAAFQKVIEEGMVINFEDALVFVSKEENRKKENKKLIAGTIAPIRNDSYEIIGTVAVLRDTTEIRKAQQKMYNMEYFDPLTGLPNRALFLDRLKMALAQSRRNKQMCVLVILDLDNFKSINETLGHAVGDELLKQAGEKIKSHLREVDTVARIGGDEFAILQPQINDIEDSTKVAYRLLEKLQKPWVLENKEYYITASMGVAIYPNDGEDEQMLLKNAETAMYRAKEEGRNNYKLFTEAMNIKVKQKLETENSLRKAIEREEFVLFYQPQIDITSRKIVGVEALLRWHRPNFGLVPPGDFIPLAEESGLIIPIGQWVLYSACAQNKKWIDQGIGPLTVSVNLSARQFQQDNLLETIKQVLNDTGLKPTQLELEITESTAMKDIDFTIQVLNHLKEMGIKISLDDFGTGYSSLNYLKCLPINNLKIDRSFVKDITTKTNEAAIAKSVIRLAHKIGLLVVAEGVETKAQLDFLTEEKCDMIQGFYFSKPLPSKEVQELLLKKDAFKDF